MPIRPQTPKLPLDRPRLFKREGFAKIGAEKKGTKKAVGYLKPYEESGQGANTLLSDALGINGPEAQQRYFANFQNDPGYIAARDAGADTITQGSSLGGYLHSGATLKALQDYGQRLMWSQYRIRDSGRFGLLSS